MPKQDTMALYRLLAEHNYIGQDLFELTEQDQQDGLTSVEEKLELSIPGSINENYAEFRVSNRDILVFFNDEGVADYVQDQLTGLEDQDAAIKLLGEFTNNFKDILGHWGIKTVGDSPEGYTMAEAPKSDYLRRASALKQALAVKKTAAGTGIGKYRRGKVLTEVTAVEPGQLLAHESIIYKATNLVKVTQTFQDKFYGVFVNPENPVEKSKAADEEFVVYPTDLERGEYYIALEPSPEGQAPAAGDASGTGTKPVPAVPVEDQPEKPEVPAEVKPEAEPEAPAEEPAPAAKGASKTAGLTIEHVGSIEDIQDRQDLQLVDRDYDIEAMKEYLGGGADVAEFDGFFVKVGDGDYDEIYGFYGSTPDLDKALFQLKQASKKLAETETATEPSIAITYETITEESAAEGDAADRGWINEEGQSMKPDEDDLADGITAVDLAVKFLKNEGASEPSSSSFDDRVWYTAYDEMGDLQTGERENRSYHLNGFTSEELRQIYDRMTGKGEDKTATRKQAELTREMRDYLDEREGRDLIETAHNFGNTFFTGDSETSRLISEWQDYTTASKKTGAFQVRYLPYNSDEYKIERGFATKQEAEQWAKGENLDELADEWEVEESTTAAKKQAAYAGAYNELWYHIVDLATGETVYEGGNNPMESSSQVSAEEGVGKDRMREFCEITGKELAAEAGVPWQGCEYEQLEDYGEPALAAKTVKVEKTLQDAQTIEELRELVKADGTKLDEDDIVRDLGKFEGEHLSTLYFYDAMMNGGGDTVQYAEEGVGSTVDVFDVSAEEAQMFGVSEKFFVLTTSDSGFVGGEFTDEPPEEEETEDEYQEDISPEGIAKEKARLKEGARRALKKQALESPVRQNLDYGKPAKKKQAAGRYDGDTQCLMCGAPLGGGEQEFCEICTKEQERFKAMQLGEGPTKVWYMKPEVFRDFNMGPRWLEKQGIPTPTKDTLASTHVMVKTVDSEDLEKIWAAMQGEVWSPMGEANGLIRSKGLQHTSMSIGDIVELPDGSLHMVDMSGFKTLGSKAKRAGQDEPASAKEAPDRNPVTQDDVTHETPLGHFMDDQDDEPSEDVLDAALSYLESEFSTQLDIEHNDGVYTIINRKLKKDLVEISITNQVKLVSLVDDQELSTNNTYEIVDFVEQLNDLAQGKGRGKSHTTEVDDFEVEPEPEFEGQLEVGGSHRSLVGQLLANIETLSSAPGGEGDNGDAYKMDVDRNFTGVNEDEVTAAVQEYLAGKAVSFASFEDFAGFVEDIYGIPKQASKAVASAWRDDDAPAIVAFIKAQAKQDLLK